MGFRPMDGFDGTAITAYNGSASQNATTSSLHNYQKGSIIFPEEKLMSHLFSISNSIRSDISTGLYSNRTSLSTSRN